MMLGSTLGYHIVNISIWPWLDSVPGRDTRTDGRTDRIPIANTRSQQYLHAGTAVARKKLGNQYSEFCCSCYFWHMLCLKRRPTLQFRFSILIALFPILPSLFLILPKSWEYSGCHTVFLWWCLWYCLHRIQFTFTITTYNNIKSIIITVIIVSEYKL